jgi:hypothetical protein
MDNKVCNSDLPMNFLYVFRATGLFNVHTNGQSSWRWYMTYDLSQPALQNVTPRDEVEILP